ncbi:MAG: AraC family transcriptional regulator [Flavobacteriales bacterium]
MNALLLNCSTRFYDRQFCTRTNLNKDHVAKFQDMLQAYFRHEKHLVSGIPSVAERGDHMGMSRAYLRPLGRRNKDQLLNFNDTVGQIAYSLGFEHPQHFSRVFKAKTGMSPGQFQKVG